MACTVGFRASYNIPQTSELVGNFRPAIATKLHGHITTCVLNTLILTLPNTKCYWLHIHVIVAKLSVFRISRHMPQSDWATIWEHLTRLYVQMSQQVFSGGRLQVHAVIHMFM